METLTLTELGARMARRWRTLVAGAAVGLLAGVLVQVVVTTRYEATTVLFVDTGAPELVDMAAEQAVATSRRVTAEALDALGEPDLSIAELEESADASVVKDSRLLRVTYAADDPHAAVRGADAVAQAYLAVRSLDPMTTSADVDAAGPVEGVVVDPARLPTSPVGAGPLATVLAATLAGTLAATPIAMRPTRRPEAPAS